MALLTHCVVFINKAKSNCIVETAWYCALPVRVDYFKLSKLLVKLVAHVSYGENRLDMAWPMNTLLYKFLSRSPWHSVSSYQY